MKGQFHNPKNGKLATISCEAIVDHGLYCWHWFAGRAGTNNDLTVLQNSPFFTSLLLGQHAFTLPEGYFVNGIHRSWPMYILTDGIYGDWAIFQKPIHSPEDDRESHYSERQLSLKSLRERTSSDLMAVCRVDSRFYAMRASSTTLNS